MKILVPLMALALLANSCKKAEPSDFVNTTASQKLTGNNWKLLQSGFDTNGDGQPQYTELHYADSTNVIMHFHLNDNGTGNVSYYNADDTHNGTADLTWTIDPTDTYITTNIPSLGTTTVSKFVTLTTMNFSVIADTSQRPYWFLYFTKE